MASNNVHFVLVLAVVLVLPISGDAFVKKLLEARLLASMMKDMNSQSMSGKFMTYPMPMRVA